MNDKIGAVVVTYNCGRTIKNTIGSVKQRVEKIVIIDNNSDEETKAVLKEIAMEGNSGAYVEVVYNNDNQGIAAALNQGISRLLEYGCHWILTLDHDSTVEKNMLDNMLNTYYSLEDNEKKNIYVLVPQVYDLHAKKITYGVEGQSEYEYMDNAIQSGALIKAESFTRMGFFNEDLFVYYVDDEFFIRVKENGGSIVMVRNAVINHEEGIKETKALFGKKYLYDNYGKYAIYYIFRNGLFMYFRYKNKLIRKRLLVDSLKILINEPRKMRYVFMGIRDYITGKKGKGGF